MSSEINNKLPTSFEKEVIEVIPIIYGIMDYKYQSIKTATDNLTRAL